MSDWDTDIPLWRDYLLISGPRQQPRRGNIIHSEGE